MGYKVEVCISKAAKSICSGRTGRCDWAKGSLEGDSHSWAYPQGVTGGAGSD